MDQEAVTRAGSGTTTTGHRARPTHWWPTDPSSNPTKPPRQREPLGISSDRGEQLFRGMAVPGQRRDWWNLIPATGQRRGRRPHSISAHENLLSQRQAWPTAGGAIRAVVISKCSRMSSPLAVSTHSAPNAAGT